MNIFITEKITDDTYQLESVSHRVGKVFYTYQSPTHHHRAGVCSVVVNYDIHGGFSLHLDWFSSVVNLGFTDIEIADAISKAYLLASNKLSQLTGESK